MKHLLSIAMMLSGVIAFAQPIPQQKKVTNKYFPEMSVNIPTPAFQKKKGFTNYDDMMTFINDLKSTYGDWMTVEFIGNSQKGKSIPQVTIAKPGQTDDKVRVWFQAGIHGNEPASTEGILYTMHQLLNDPDLKKVLDKLVVTIVPMANIDGYEKQDRYAANGLDLNRDQTKLMAPESVVLKRAFSRNEAHVAVDFHEYRPYRRDFAKLSTIGTTAYYDIMFMYSGNLNVNSELRDFTKSYFVDNAGLALDEQKLRHREYVSTTDIHGEIQFNQGSNNARSSATSYALTNCISSLIEVRGVALGRTSFNRRTFTTYTVAKSYLTSAYTNADKVKQIVEKAQTTFDGPAIVKSSKHIESQKIPMIDIHTNDVIEIEAVVRNASKCSPKLEREKPYAYVILPGNDKAIANLKTLGIKVDSLSSETQITVSAYTVDSWKTEPYKYEGVKRQFVTTQLNEKQLTVPAGSYVIYTQQAKGGLITEVLEPEAPNSFITFNVISCSNGSELPIYRYLETKKL